MCTTALSDPGTVFVVDNKADVCKRIAALAFSIKIDAATYGSAEEFLECYEEERTGCVVSEIRLPGMGGLQLQQRLKEMASPLPVVFLTDSAEVSLVACAMGRGAVTVLAKPCAADELATVMRVSLALGAERFRRRQDRTDFEGRLVSLFPEEHEVMELLMLGRTNTAIAEKLTIGLRTAERLRARILEKLGVASTIEMACRVTEFRMGGSDESARWRHIHSEALHIPKHGIATSVCATTA